MRARQLHRNTLLARTTVFALYYQPARATLISSVAMARLEKTKGIKLTERMKIEIDPDVYTR
jgi:hypothetical protein